MDWARDHLGVDVPAWKGGISGFGLVCPSCGEPVRRRAGRERRPHFAHYSHRAKPDCENYFPAFGTPALVAQTVASRALLPTLVRESLSCCLFLGEEGAMASLLLWLRLPSLPPAQGASGRLEIQSASGLRHYDIADLQTTRRVPLSPQVPLAGVTGFGDALPLAAHVAKQVGAFRGERNLFYAEERAGRLVFEDESLEWGCQYRMLAIDVITPPDTVVLALNWKHERKLGAWHVYGLSLPPDLHASASGLSEEVSLFLGRRIRSRRPTVHVVHPLPHHFDVDRAHVYPEWPSELLLRRSGAAVVSLVAAHAESTATVTDLGDEWIRVRGLDRDEQEYTLAVDGAEHSILRVECCERFLPGSPIVRTHSLSWELCTDAPISPKELLHQDVRIDCGSERLAAHIARRNGGWALDGMSLVALSGASKRLMAGSLGRLRGTGATQSPAALFDQEVPDAFAQRAQTPKELWLEQLINAAFGVDGLVRLRQFLADPARDLRKLGPEIVRSRLLAYILASVRQRQQSVGGARSHGV